MAVTHVTRQQLQSIASLRRECVRLDDELDYYTDSIHEDLDQIEMALLALAVAESMPGGDNSAVWPRLRITAQAKALLAAMGGVALALNQDALDTLSIAKGLGGSMAVVSRQVAITNLTLRRLDDLLTSLIGVSRQLLVPDDLTVYDNINFWVNDMAAYLQLIDSYSDVIHDYVESYRDQAALAADIN